MRLLAVVSFLALLRPALSTDEDVVPAGGERADPTDYREYLGAEGIGDSSSTFLAECIAQIVARGIPSFLPPTVDGMLQACVEKGQKAGVVLRNPYASDWARWLEFEPFFRYLSRHMTTKVLFFWNFMRGETPQYIRRELARAVSQGTDACRPKLPATVVHRPLTSPGHEGAPAAPVTDTHTATLEVAEHGAPPNPFRYQYRHPAAHRAAGLSRPLDWFRKLVPALLREIRPALRRAGAALEKRPRVMEEYR
ncbi:MAG: hypothetical protein M1826_002466 [Phylliscum demangeonii]|nr:MAG: hypothetical protein M1826_002466 [Phylliscum demangeonii]